MPKIIDAHQHFWDIRRNHHPWLCGTDPIAFRYGDYGPLRRNYLPPDYHYDAAGLNIVGSVCIEAEWDPLDSLGEVAWLADVIARYDLNNVIVAQAWLDRSNIVDVLAHHGAHPLVRGIRHKPTAASAPNAVDDYARGSMTDPDWIAGFSLLARYGLSFDLQAPWWHFEQARRLAETHPDTQIILNHTGLPSDRTASGLAGWRAAMAELSKADNVAVKISGLGIPGRHWNIKDHAAIILDTIDLFGPDRCMFASNFPVDGLVGNFSTIIDGFLHVSNGFTTQERQLMFHDNALRIYRLKSLKRKKEVSS